MENIKKLLENFDLNLMNYIERSTYNVYRLSLPKIPSLLKLMKEDNLSYYLNELKEIIKLNEENIKYYE